MSDAPSEAKAIFFEALDRKSADELRQYLDAACGDDQELRSRVEGLLRAHHEAGNFLGGSLPVAATADLPAFPERLGTHIGPYRLLQRLGEGGMGVVFLAEQKEPVERQVALKIVRPGMDTQRVIARFEAERQALAMMDHPNVAKVLDVGTIQAAGRRPEAGGWRPGTGEGSDDLGPAASGLQPPASSLPPAASSLRPYFVMELVQGIAITKYCDQHHLSIRERLDLFIPVCQAVQHAHQKGIIHRDIKPSNILVAEFDGRPVPKVIDFGVAKAIDHGTVQKQLSTQYGQIVGTLEYMSPEQARLSPHDVDTRSDVYSLGAVLYELLTGITPFDKDRLYAAAFEQALHIIEAEEPPPPSQRLSSSGSLPSVAALRHIEPQRLTGLIRGELDWIVMKSLEKDRSRRYESAAGLAQDIDRYLHDQPVLAGPPSAGYLLRKFVRRNKSILATTTMVAMALVVGTGVAAWQAVRAHGLADRAGEAAIRAEEERNRAQATLQTAMQAVDEIYTDLAEEYLTTIPMMEPMKVQLLEGAIRFYTEFSTVHASDRDLCYERAKAYSRLGCCHRWLGHNVEAERALRTALTLFEQLPADIPHSAKYQLDLARCCMDLGYLLHDDDLRNTESEGLFGRAISALEQLPPTLEDDLEYQRRVAAAHQGLGWRYFLKACYPQAATETRQAIVLFERLLDEHPQDVISQYELSLTYRGLAQVYEAQGPKENAGEYYEKALDLQQQIAALPPVNPDYRHHLSVTYCRYGRFLEHYGRAQEAEEQYRQSLHVSAALAEDFPHVPAYRDGWRYSYYCLGQLLGRGSRSGDAERTLREVIDLGERLVKQWPTFPSFQQQLSTVYIDFGFTLQCGGRFAEAEQQLQQAVSLAETLVRDTPDDPENLAILARAKNHLGLVLHTTQGSPEAEQSHRQAMTILEELVAKHPAVSAYRLELSFSHEYLAKVLRATGRLDAAEQHFRKCLALQEALVEEDFDHDVQFLAITNTWFGDLLRDARRDDEAAQTYRQAMTLYERLRAEYPGASTIRDQMVSTLRSMIRVANAHGSRGHHTEAVELLGEVLEVSRRTLEPEHRDTLRIMDNAATAYFRLGRDAEAHQLYAEELEVRRRTLPEDHVTLAPNQLDIVKSMNSLAWLLATCPDTQLRAPQEAINLATKVVELMPNNGEYQNTLGVAQYRVGNYSDALETLQKSIAQNSGNAYDSFLLSMAHRQLGNSEESQNSYDQAVAWMEKNDPDNPELQLLRAEAAQLLGVNENSPSAEESAAADDANSDRPSSAEPTDSQIIQPEGG